MTGYIDLENFDDNVKQDDSTVKVETSQETAHDVSVVKTETTKLADIYDRFQKMVYAFDVSDSMADGILPGEIDKVADWTPETLQLFRVRIAENSKAGYGWDSHLAQVKTALTTAKLEGLRTELESTKEEIENLTEELKDNAHGLDADEKTEIKEMVVVLKERAEELLAEINAGVIEPSLEEIEAEAVKLHAGFDINDDYQLKLNVYTRGLDKSLKVPLVRTGLGLTTKSKIDTVRISAKDLIVKRLEKYPEASIDVITFANKVKVISTGTTKETLLEKISNLHLGGGTDIFAAVRKAIDLCKKSPSALATNHIILVTDGESYTVDQLTAEVIDEMKSNNIVLDLIFIKGMYASAYTPTYERFLEKIKAVVTATGGEVIEVSNAEAFTKKLRDVSSRLLIPAKVG